MKLEAESCVVDVALIDGYAIIHRLALLSGVKHKF